MQTERDAWRAAGRPWPRGERGSRMRRGRTPWSSSPGVAARRNRGTTPPLRRRRRRRRRRWRGRGRRRRKRRRLSQGVATWRVDPASLCVSSASHPPSLPPARPALLPPSCFVVGLLSVCSPALRSPSSFLYDSSRPIYRFTPSALALPSITITHERPFVNTGATTSDRGTRFNPNDSDTAYTLPSSHARAYIFALRHSRSQESWHSLTRINGDA